MAQTDVSPEKLRFTQESIKNMFKKPYDNQRIDNAVDQIRNKQLSPGVLMPLTVVHYRSLMWSLDNRRLWVLRKAGVPTVKVIFVPPNHIRRSENFFSSLSDPHLERQYSSADYFPRVRGRCRYVGNHGAPPPPIPLQLDIPTRVNIADSAQANMRSPSQLPLRDIAGATQANYRPPNSPPPQRPLGDITLRSNIPQISPLPDNYHQKRNTVVSNSNSCPGGKKGSDTLWGKILNAVNCAMEKGLGILRFLRSWNFDPCSSLVVLCLCFALRQSYKLGQGSVYSKLYSRETITASEGLENVLRAENGSGSFKNAFV